MFTCYRVDSGRTHCLFYRFRDVFSRYRIYHFEDWTFSRYRSIAGKRIKNRSHILQCFADLLQNVFGRFSRIALPQSTYIPREPWLLSPRPNWDSLPPLPCGGVPSDDWRKSLALCLLCGPYKIREKYIKSY